MRKIYRINDIKKNLEIARFRPLDVLVVGGTGAGKSTTLNALFEMEVAGVGRGCDPETTDIRSGKLNDFLRFWDSPGLGDGKESDKKYSEKLIDVLYKDYILENGQYGLIDTVLVVVDGSGRDMGTTYQILNDIIIPNFQPDRILVAINQADMAMKGRHWNDKANRPDSELKKFLDDKSDSVKRRLKEATGVDIRRPVYYSAERQYNVDGLLDLIIDNMPRKRRSLVV